MNEKKIAVKETLQLKFISAFVNKNRKGRPKTIIANSLNMFSLNTHFPYCITELKS